ncbi:MAG TPA: outer membrane beta-barrel protein [Bacteroidales bacterium]|nr:outer membrane beta-barrel protein [Bacteroidales bacterium]
MKKVYVMALALCLTAMAVYSQGVYVRVGLGGGVGLKQYGSVSLNPMDDTWQGMWANITSTNNATTAEFKSLGLGGGFNVNLAAGYMLSQYVGLELGVNEFIGMAKKVNLSATVSSGSYVVSQTIDLKRSGMMLQLVPAIVITPGLESINPYARVGMIVGILPSITSKGEGTATNTGGYKATSSFTYKSVANGGLALGFTAAGGVSFNLSDQIGLYGELVYNGITYSPKKGKFKEYKEDGIDNLPTMTTKDKEWTFEKELNDVDIPDGTPNKVAKTTVNFSNVELNVGIRIKFGE